MLFCSSHIQYPLNCVSTCAILNTCHSTGLLLSFLSFISGYIIRAPTIILNCLSVGSGTHKQVWCNPRSAFRSIALQTSAFPVSQLPVRPSKRSPPPNVAPVAPFLRCQSVSEWKYENREAFPSAAFTCGGKAPSPRSAAFMARPCAQPINKAVLRRGERHAACTSVCCVLRSAQRRARGLTFSKQSQNGGIARALLRRGGSPPGGGGGAPSKAEREEPRGRAVEEPGAPRLWGTTPPARRPVMKTLPVGRA